MIRNRGFKVAALAASIALAMGSTAAMAVAGTPTQLPGQGAVSGTGSVTPGTITAGAQTIGVSGNEVINWGTGTDVNPDGIGGFNISAGAALTFSDTSSGTGSAVLNIDSSGNTSQIFGALTADGTNVFVANANGIIVGNTAQVSGTGNVSLIANTLSPTAASDFASGGSFAYDGSGGDVAVQAGAVVGTSTLVSGGGTVNVDLGAFTAGNVTLSSGLPSDASTFGAANADAALNVSGSLGAATLVGFSSAGTASNAGTLDLSGVGTYSVGGLFTNTGDLTLPYENGAVHNLGTLSTPSNYTDINGNLVEGGIFDGGLVNDGSFNAGSSLQVYNGDLVNNGGITNAGEIYVGNGNFTNTEAATVSGTAGVFVDGGSLTNAGTLAAGGGITMWGGDLTNSGTVSGTGNVSVTDGSIVNSGTLGDVSSLTTASDADRTAGADYSISNTGTGTIAAASGTSYLAIDANLQNRVGGSDNDTTGSFTNTGTLSLSNSAPLPPCVPMPGICIILPPGPITADATLDISANNDLALGGSVKVGGSVTSASNPLSLLNLYSDQGTTTLATPLTFGTGATVSSGSQVKLMANLTGLSGNDSTALVSAGDKLANDYAIRVATGVTLSADSVGLQGYTETDHPNVILQGTVAGNAITFGQGAYYGSAGAVSDVFNGVAGAIMATGTNPLVDFDFTGRIKSAPYLNDANFRYNYLPISVTGGTGLTLSLNPVAYATNGTSNGLSAVNLLANGDVTLTGTGITPYVMAGGYGVTDALQIPNTHLVLQSTGNITTDGAFYWPGYVYLGTIGTNSDGSAAPGTLGYGSIALRGDFNNVLPGSVDFGGGIHFITQFALQMHGHSVTTNANSLINFGTDTLTAAYASGGQGDGLFFAGTKGYGNIVNYGAMDPSLFVTQAPISAK